MDRNQCPLCRNPKAKVSGIGTCRVSCPSCGDFGITNDAYDFQIAHKEEEVRWKLSAIIRERNVRQRPQLTLFSERPKDAKEETTLVTVDELLTSWPSTYDERIQRILTNLRKLSPTIGHFVSYTHRDRGLFFSRTSDEFSQILLDLHKRKLVEFYANTPSTTQGAVKISSDGWRAIDQAKTTQHSAKGKQMVDLFLSWSGKYAHEIAKKLKIAIDQFGESCTDDTPAIKSWLSSVDIELGKEFRTELHKALQKADVGIVVVTQDVIDSHWLPHEAGALYGRCERLIILLADAPPSILPDPLKDYQYGTLENDDIKKLFTTIAKDAAMDDPSQEFVAKLCKEIARIRKRFTQSFVIADEFRWGGKFERPFAIARQENSPYDLEQLMGIAQHQLILVAQNHFYMTEADRRDRGDEKFWPLVKILLEKSVDVDIVAMHPAANSSPLPRVQEGATTDAVHPDALALWARYMRSTEFMRHIEETWITLDQWASRFRELCLVPGNNLGRLRLWKAYFTPVTMSFIDPRDPKGLLVISPRMSDDANADRPQFIVKSSTCPITFAYYWKNVNNCFINCGWTLHSPTQSDRPHNDHG